MPATAKWTLRDQFHRARQRRELSQTIIVDSLLAGDEQMGLPVVLSRALSTSPCQQRLQHTGDWLARSRRNATEALETLGQLGLSCDCQVLVVLDQA